ncbi:hexitol phosphatase HxpB [Algoriphagus halophytocola]|uniref:hexitol phosphatase HxpB n=1 Tax=Algoriphagus halophytocola TaxID=2991499 RepID=UPI0022DCFE66|nr:hexitol phosphatase HxpB [Algoriphagus sp. TR-M9]WBL44230.1 hexitol phosphatase HxpB [Algoriphagus sp. TR-M9]
MSLEARLRGKKAVIFDMDGVIIDTEKIWKKAEKEVFSALGVKVTNENSKVTEAMTTPEVAHHWFAQFPWKGKSLQEAEQLVIQRVSALIETEECLIDGVKRFLEGLRSQNYKIGLATNSPQEIIPTVLRRLEITHLFDVVSSAEMEEKGKPHPAVYLSTARKLNVSPKDCLVIEDSYSGMMAAKNAGMEVAAFTNGNQHLNFEIADCHILNY